MTLIERAKSALQRNKHLIDAEVTVQSLYYGNDLGWAARWSDGARNAVRAEDIIPVGGLSDERLDELTISALTKLRDWKARK